MQTKNWIERYSLFWALLLVSGLFGVAYFLLSPVWGTAMEQQLHWQLVEGSVQTNNLQPIVFNLLEQLYALRAELPWLALCLYSLQGLSLWALSALFLYQSGSRWRIALFAIGMSALFWPIWQSPTIFATALLLSATAIFLLWQSFRIQKHWQSWLFCCLAALFMSTAVALDFQASIAGLCLLPLLLHRWIFQPKQTLRHLLQVALLTLFSLGILWTSLESKSTQKQVPPIAQEVLPALQKYDWEAYRWTKERALFYHRQLGWRAADYRLVQAGYSADADFLAPEVLQLLKEELGDQPRYSREGSLRKLNRFALHHLRYAGGWLGLLFLVFLLAITSFKALEGLAWAVLASILAWLAYLLYWILLWEAPVPLFFASLAMVGLLTLLLAGFKGQLSRANKWTILFMLFAVLAGQIIWNWEDLQATRQLPQQAKKVERQLAEDAYILILEEADFVLGQSLWVKPSVRPQLHYLKDWNSFPAEQLSQNLEDAPHYLFLRKGQTWAEDYQAHLLEHYRLPIRLDSLDFDEGTGIYLYALERDSL